MNQFTDLDFFFSHSELTWTFYLLPKMSSPSPQPYIKQLLVCQGYDCQLAFSSSWCFLFQAHAHLSLLLSHASKSWCPSSLLRLSCPLPSLSVLTHFSCHLSWPGFFQSAVQVLSCLIIWPRIRIPGTFLLLALIRANNTCPAGCLGQNVLLCRAFLWLC